MTKTYRVLVGECVDGTGVYVTSSTPVCKNCGGNGRYWCEAGYEPWQKAGWVQCECCNGSGEGKEEE